MSNLLKIVIIFTVLTNCSLQPNSKFWTKSERIVEFKNKKNKEAENKKKRRERARKAKENKRPKLSKA